MAATSAAPAKPREIVEIERLGFGYAEVAQYDLASVAEKRRVQVREQAHYERRDLVGQYAVHMTHSQFPPIVVTRDGAVVDGNTRIAARLLRKENFIHAIVLDVDWQGAPPKLRGELIALAATLNQFGGERLTPKEIRVITSEFVALGWLNEQIGRALGVKPSTVTGVRKELDAQAKLEKVGLKINGNMRDAAVRALGAKEVLALNDVPFKDLAELARDADLNAKEIVDIAKAAKETGSDKAALARLADLRAEYRDRIKQKELTGAGKPPMSAQVRQHLGMVLKFEGREDELLETDPDVSAKHAETLEKAVGVLNKVLAMQRGSSK